MLVPAVQLQGDYFVSPNFSLGAFAAYVKAEGAQAYAGGTIVEHHTNQSWAAGLRTTAYSNLLGDQWRIYGGIALGAVLPTVTTTVEVLGEPKDTDFNVARFHREPQTSMLFSGYVGVQYYLTPVLSATGEAGYGLSLLNLGLRYKL